MTEGWTIKEAGAVLDVNPKKIPQALYPSYFKIAKLMLADPYKTHVDMLKFMAHLVHEQDDETPGSSAAPTPSSRPARLSRPSSVSPS